MSQGQAVSPGPSEGGRLPGNVPETCHRNIRQIVEYWVRIHPETGLPGRQHFDPLDVPQLLPNIRLLDVVGQPPRFRVRLMGTRLCEFFGRDHTGMWLDEVFPNLKKSATYEGLMNVVRSKEPRWRRGKPALDFEKDFMDMERVYLPFARDRRAVDMVLTYLLCIDADGRFY